MCDRGRPCIRPQGFQIFGGGESKEVACYAFYKELIDLFYSRVEVDVRSVVEAKKITQRKAISFGRFYLDGNPGKPEEAAKIFLYRGDTPIITLNTHASVKESEVGTRLWMYGEPHLQERIRIEELCKLSQEYGADKFAVQAKLVCRPKEFGGKCKAASFPPGSHLILSQTKVGEDYGFSIPYYINNWTVGDDGDTVTSNRFSLEPVKSSATGLTRGDKREGGDLRESLDIMTLLMFMKSFED